MMLADQVEEALKEELSRLREKPGEVMLPQQPELAKRYGVSLRTIRTVFERLKNAGLIRTVKGQGTFAADPESGPGRMLLIADNPSHAYTAIALGTTSELLMQRGITPVLARPDQLYTLTEHTRGSLIFSGGLDVEVYLKRRKLPCCAINDIFDLDQPQTSRFQTVRCNSYLWIYTATEILLKRGKRRILLFTSGEEFNWGRAKVQGYCDALRKYGIVPDESLIHYVAHRADLDPVFCAELRTALERETARTPCDVLGCVDASPFVFAPDSPLYRLIACQFLSAEEAVATEFSESTVTSVAGTLVVPGLRYLIDRAIGIVTGEVKPFALCETHDCLTIRINDGQGRWRNYASVAEAGSHIFAGLTGI